jgi:hypothetical protein
MASFGKIRVIFIVILSLFFLFIMIAMGLSIEDNSNNDRILKNSTNSSDDHLGAAPALDINTLNKPDLRKEGILTICSSDYYDSNDNFSLSFGETKSENWIFNNKIGESGDALYLEHFAAYSEDWDSVKVSDNDFIIDQRFDESPNGRTAILHYDDLEITREIDVPRETNYFFIKYTLTNTDRVRSLTGLKFFEAVDYDIVTPGDDYGWYIPNTDSIWQNDPQYFRNGFLADKRSSNHGIDYWKTELYSDWNDTELNGISRYPEEGTDDVAVAQQWNVGDLSPGEFWQITLRFYFGEMPDINADAGSDKILGRNQPVMLDASRSSSSEGYIISYEWDLNGDEIYEVEEPSPFYNFSGWDEIGDHTAYLKVTDDRGYTGTDTVTFTVTPMFTIELHPENDRTKTSVGGAINYSLELSNKQDISDLFTLETKGVDKNWITLNRSVYLLSGESAKLPLNIIVPPRASGGDYVLAVSAFSSNLNINEETISALNVSNEPMILDLSPEDNMRTGSIDILFNWKTYAKSSSKLYFKMEDEPNFKLLSGKDGLDHVILAENLSRNTWYEFYVESKSAKGTSKSDSRRFYIDNGVSFSNRLNDLNIERNYNQQRSISVTNTDSRPHDLLVTIYNPYDDLYLDFIGNGSADQALSLSPGETKTVDLIIHSQDAELENYSLRLDLETMGGEDIRDHAIAYVNVRQPSINFSLEEIGEDPITLTKAFRVTNHGDPLTDLDVDADDQIKSRVLIQPTLQHASLNSGESAEFSVSPLWSEDMGSIKGSLTAKAAGKSKAIKMGYACEDGRQRYEVTLNHPILHFDLKGAYCINAHHIEDSFSLPASLKAEDVEYSRIGMELNARDGQSRPYNVWIKINGQDVGTIEQTFPKGHYEFDIDPSYLNYAQAGMAANLYTLDSDIPGSYYTPLTDVRLIMCVKELKLYICADSEEQAEEIAWSQPYIYRPAESIAVKIRSPEEGSNLAVGEPVTIKAEVSGERGAEKLSVVKATVNGEEIVLADNGQHGDGQKDDGVYANTWTPPSEGQTEIRVTASNCASTGSDRVTVTGMMSQLVVRPAFWNIGEIEECGIIEQSFEIESSSSVLVSSISAPEWVKLSYFPPTQIEPGHPKHFVAALDPKKKGILVGDIVILSDDTAKHELRVPISGMTKDLAILAEAAKLRDQFEETSRSIARDSSDMGFDALTKAFFLGAQIGAGKLIEKFFSAMEPFEIAGKRPLALKIGDLKVNEILPVESGGKYKLISIKDWRTIVKKYSSFAAIYGDLIPRAGVNVIEAGSKSFNIKELEDLKKAGESLTYTAIGGEYYGELSQSEYEQFAEELCKRLSTIDKKGSIKYLKMKQLKIADMPNWPTKPLDLSPIFAVTPGTQFIPVICLIDKNINVGFLSCDDVLKPSISFNFLKQIYSLIDHCDEWLNYLFILIIVIGILISIFASGGISAIAIAAVLSKIGLYELSKDAAILIMLIVCWSASLSIGNQLVSVAYFNDVEQSFDNVLYGGDLGWINDPEGPIITKLHIDDIPLWKNGALLLNFTNNETPKLNVTPLIVLKSLSGYNFGQVLGEPIGRLESNKSVDFNISIAGTIPGTYKVYAMVIYNDTFITPPKVVRFNISQTNSAIKDVLVNGRYASKQSSISIISVIENNVTLDHETTIWTSLISQNGTTIASDVRSVAKEEGIHSYNISLPTDNATEDGIYEIKSMLIDILYPIDEKTTTAILGIESGKYQGILIRGSATEDGYRADESISINLALNNVGNTNLSGVLLTYDLIGNKQIFSKSTIIGNISRNSTSSLDLNLSLEEHLPPDLYVMRIVATNQDGGALGNLVVPVTITGNGTSIPVTTTDREIYDNDESINVIVDIYDDLGFYLKESNVSAEMLDPYQRSVDTLDLESFGNGSYSGYFSKTKTNGTYSIKVHTSNIDYRSYDDETHFIVNNPSKLNCTLRLSDISYKVNQSVPFTVNITSESVPIDSSMIAKVIMPNNESYTVATYKDTRGNYTGTIWNTPLPGVYRISVETRKVYYEDVDEFLEFDVINKYENRLVTSQNGTCRATIIGSTSTGDTTLGLLSPYEKMLFTAAQGAVGRSKDLRNYSAGTNLIFFLDASDGSRHFSSDLSSCRITNLCEDIWQLSWEDGVDGDSDFNDLLVEVEVLPNSVCWGFDEGFQGWERTGTAGPWHGYTLRDAVKWQEQWAGSQGVLVLDACDLSAQGINASAGIMNTIKVPAWAKKLTVDVVKQEGDGGARIVLNDSKGDHVLVEEILKRGESKSLTHDLTPWAGEIVTLEISAFGAGDQNGCGPERNRCCQEQIGVASVQVTGGSYYEFVPYTMSWQDAFNYSAEVGGHLVTLSNAEEDQHIADLLQKMGVEEAIWIGLIRYGERFHWTTGEPFNYVNWCSGEPNNQSDCNRGIIGLCNQSWSCQAGDQLRPFVIEFDEKKNILPGPEDGLEDDGHNVTGYVAENMTELPYGDIALPSAESFSETVATSEMDPVLRVQDAIAYYSFDNGDARDDSEHGWNGTVHGSAISEGIRGNSLSFNGIDQYADLPLSIKNNFSISFWVKTSQTADTGQWYDGNGLVDAEYCDEVDDFGTALLGGKASFGVGNPDTTIESIRDINDDNWHHIVAVRVKESGEIKLYIDGILEASGEASRSSLTASTWLGVGNNPCDTSQNRRWFSGSIDEIGIYNIALNEEEVNALYNTYL